MSRRYGSEPEDSQDFIRRFNIFYTRFAPFYDQLVKRLPTWKKWLKLALPYIQGQRVLEISFGTGYLLTQYAARFETYGIDYNRKMLQIARANLRREKMTAQLQIASVEALPYPDEAFDSIVNTMAFSGYPDGQKAMSEMYRVLKPDGILVMIDVNYPANQNWLGTAICYSGVILGDIVRDMAPLFKQVGFDYTDREIGGFGGVHLYTATKRQLGTN